MNVSVSRAMYNDRIPVPGMMTTAKDRNSRCVKDNDGSLGKRKTANPTRVLTTVNHHPEVGHLNRG